MSHATIQQDFVDLQQHPVQPSCSIIHFQSYFVQKREKRKAGLGNGEYFPMNSKTSESSSFCSFLVPLLTSLWYHQHDPTWPLLAFVAVCRFFLWSSPCWKASKCCAAHLGIWNVKHERMILKRYVDTKRFPYDLSYRSSTIGHIALFGNGFLTSCLTNENTYFEARKNKNVRIQD